MESEEKKENKVLVKHWTLIFRTWSFWLYVASALLTLAEQVLPFFNILQPILSEKEYLLGMFCLNVAAILSKFIKQENLQKLRERLKNDNKLV